MLCLKFFIKEPFIAGTGEDANADNDAANSALPLEQWKRVAHRPSC